MPQHTRTHSHSSSTGAAQTHVTVLEQVSNKMQRCIKNCTDCHNICRDTLTHCLERGGEHAQADHIWLLMDCAEMCMTSAHFMMHNSELHGATCSACAEVCDRCAEDCARFSDDRLMQACADMCRRCADSCRQMATAA
jgi:hypothetical protein